MKLCAEPNICDRPVTATLRPADVNAIVGLVNADHLVGLPICYEDDVERALRADSTVDVGWWRRFEGLETTVAIDGGEVVGAVSYAYDPTESTGYVLWMHCAENEHLSERLVSHALASLGQPPKVHAFWIATPLALGLEGLPIRRREVAHTTMLEAGFAGADLWAYLVGQPVVDAEEVARVEPSEDNVVGVDERWHLTMEVSASIVGRATIGVGRCGTGVVWWIEVPTEHRGKGYGRRLLRQGMKILGDRGATQIVLYVDHDDPTSRDRGPALQLYKSLGFGVVDHLWSYSMNRGQAS